MFRTINFSGAADDHGDVPQSNCSCGIYGYYDLAGIGRVHGDKSNRTTIFHGLVAVGGDIIKAEYGFKAQAAIPIALFTEKVSFNIHGYEMPALPVYEAIAERYEIPLISPSQGLEWALGRGYEQMDRPTSVKEVSEIDTQKTYPPASWLGTTSSNNYLG